MSNLPQTRLGQLQWFEARLQAWADNAVAIGLTAPIIAAFKTTVQTARGEFEAAETARASSKSATQDWYNACTAMRDPGRTYIATIKAKAEITNNPDVYSLAMVDPPAPPTPVPAPSTPTALTGSVSPTGSVTISWDADASGPSSGIFFMVQRQREGEAAYTLIGGTQEKSFLDPSAHVGNAAVRYQVRAQRGTDASSWTVPIIFDMDSGGGFTATTQEPAKLAA